MRPPHLMGLGRHVRRSSYKETPPTMQTTFIGAHKSLFILLYISFLPFPPPELPRHRFFSSRHLTGVDSSSATGYDHAGAPLRRCLALARLQVYPTPVPVPEERTWRNWLPCPAPLAPRTATGSLHP